MPRNWGLESKNMVNRDWHIQQKRNDKRVNTSLKYIEKLMNSDILANNMDVSDWDSLRAMAKEVQKLAAKYEQRG